MVPNYPNGKVPPAGTVATQIVRNTGSYNGQPIDTIIYYVSQDTATS